jgi:hypothetical protein
MEVSARNALSLTILIVATALAAVAVVGARSAEAVPQDESVEVKLLGSGSLLDDGTTVEVRVLVRCPPTPPLLEALVTGSQEGNVGFAEGFFLAVTCDGRTHVEVAQLHTFDGERFVEGKAFVSAFVLLCDETGAVCFSGGDTRFVRLH